MANVCCWDEEEEAMDVTPLINLPQRSRLVLYILYIYLYIKKIRHRHPEQEKNLSAKASTSS